MQTSWISVQASSPAVWCCFLFLLFILSTSFPWHPQPHSRISELAPFYGGIVAITCIIIHNVLLWRLHRPRVLQKNEQKQIFNTVLSTRTFCSDGNVLYLLYLVWYSLAILWEWVLETWLVWLRNWTKELSHIGLGATAQDSTANNNAPKQNNTNKDLLVRKPRKEIIGMPKILKESQRREKKKKKKKKKGTTNRWGK